MVKEIEEAVARKFSKHRYKLYNSYVFSWESDFFSVTTDGKYIYEVEIKISRADFKADFDKGHKHKMLSQTAKKLVTIPSSSTYKEWNAKLQLYAESSAISFKNPQEVTPNRFYYACPEGLLKKEEVPEYAGLIYVDDRNNAREVKKAPLLHKERNFKKLASVLLDKFYFQWEHMRTQFLYTKDIQTKFDRMQREHEKMKEAVDLHNLGATIEQLEHLKKEKEKEVDKRYKIQLENNMLYQKLKELCRKHGENVDNYL